MLLLPGTQRICNRSSPSSTDQLETKATIPEIGPFAESAHFRYNHRLSSRCESVHGACSRSAARLPDTLREWRKNNTALAYLSTPPTNTARNRLLLLKFLPGKMAAYVLESILPLPATSPGRSKSRMAWGPMRCRFFHPARGCGRAGLRELRMPKRRDSAPAAESLVSVRWSSTTTT